MIFPLPADPETLRRQIEALDDKLEAALAQAESGKKVDIRVFQKSATAFCDQVVKLPAAEAKTFQSAIADLIRKLDALERALTKSSA
jgi:molecular chaperone GrpE (heat shock protein)